MLAAISAGGGRVVGSVAPASRSQVRLRSMRSRAAVYVAVGPHSPIGYNDTSLLAPCRAVAVGPHSPIGYNIVCLREMTPIVAVGPHSPIGYNGERGV